MKYFIIAYKAKSEKLLPTVFNSTDDAFQFARVYMDRYKRVKKCQVYFLGAYAPLSAGVLLSPHIPFAQPDGDDLPF